MDRSKTRALSAQFTLEKCQFCHKNVYIMERIEAAGNVFHKQCLKCETCRHVLTASNFSYFEGKYYCKPHAKRAKTGFDECFMRRQLTFKKLKTETEVKTENQENDKEVEKGEGTQEREKIEKELAHLRSEKEQWEVEKEKMEVEIAELRRAKEKEAEERKNERERLESEVDALCLEVAKEKEEAEKAREAITQIRVTWGKLHSKYELLEEQAITLAKLKQERATGKTNES